MNAVDPESLDWEKGQGLLPAVVQNPADGRVLMVGYMNRAALEETLRSGRVTFFSRRRGGLWTKGETSGHFLHLEAVLADCDRDTLLVVARPQGPTCHTGAASCFGPEAPGPGGVSFLVFLDDLIRRRRRERPSGSYTTRLFESGLVRIAQKVGEEAVETVVSVNEPPERTVEEAADLLYHLLVLLAERDLSLPHVVSELERRHRS